MTFSTTPARMIGMAMRISGVPAASSAVISLSRLSRTTVNAAATTAIMPGKCTKKKNAL